MVLRSTQLYFAAIALAIAAVSMTAPAARAFTQENLNVNGSGGSKFADPDDQVNNFGQGIQPFGSGGPVVQFGAQGQQGQSIPSFSPYRGFQGGVNSGPPPQPYAMPLGNGN
jgi:hypothetical protein